MLAACRRVVRPQTLLRAAARRPLSSSGGGSHSDFERKTKVETSEADSVRHFIKNTVEANPVTLFMKGTPEYPQCGFSQQVVRILHAEDVEFASVNVLEDAEVREGIKQYSEWPTIPQLYVNGEFVGGCDIVTQLYQSQELSEMLPKEAKKE